jgi:hypothetical protein
MPLTKADAPRNRREPAMAKAKGEVVIAPTEADATISSTDEKTGVTSVKTGKAARSAISKALDGPTTPEPLRALARKLPEKDKVQKATKAAMLAESPKEEAQQKAIVVQESPNADETPSGKALLAVADIDDPLEQGEKYEQIKSAVRHGTANVVVE